MKNCTADNEIFLTEEDIFSLSQLVKGYLTEKRYLHTLSVMREAEKIGKVFLPDKIEKLKAAALLHDITKREDTKKQLQYCAEFGIMVKIGESHSPSVLHAITASFVAERDFPRYTDPEIVSGVRWHTTGHNSMTLFEAIIYLADFIEETRTFDDCIKLREFFYKGLEKHENKLVSLYETMIYSFDLTLRNLINEGSIIDGDTVAARNCYIARLTAETGKSEREL